MNLLKQIFILSILMPIYIFGWRMESGTLTLPSTASGSLWQTITLKQSYSTTPLIFVLVDEGSGYKGDTPVTVRIKNITLTSFDMVQVESSSVVEALVEQGIHPSINVHYLAIEAGEHTLRDGTKIVASLHNTTSIQSKSLSNPSWDNISFSTAFNNTPILLSTIQGVANESASLPSSPSSPWITTAIRSVTNSDFDISLERAETSTGTISTDEAIAYLAVEGDIQSNFIDINCSSVQYETLLTSKSIKGWGDKCNSYNFINSYGSLPNIIGTQNSRNGGDGGWLRRCSLSASKVGLTIDEDQAVDSERKHTSEIGGLFIFERDFIYNSTQAGICVAPQIDLRMDECFWVGGANGITGDVEDSSPNLLHGTSRYKASNELNNNKICRGGHFGNTYGNRNLSDAITYPNESIDESNIAKSVPFSFSIWVYRNNVDKWMTGVIRSSNSDWQDGWGLVHYSGSRSKIDFFVGRFNVYARTSLSTNTWTHLAGTYDGTTIRLYKNGTLASSRTQYSYVAGNLPLSVGDDAIALSYDDRWEGELDELKVWNRLLSANEIKSIYDFENIGLNYDGSTRQCRPCNGTYIKANTWEAISLPAELRDTTVTVDDIFSDDMNGSLYSNWILYKRAYSSVDNSSSYVALGLSDKLEFGVGYWLASKSDVFWDIDGTTNTDYNSTDTACLASSCVEIDLATVTLNHNIESVGTSGPYRYTLNSFTALTRPVDWADCRFIITDLNGNNKEILTPSQADTLGYINKQIWLYNPNNIGANSNGYTVCDDTSPGGCKLLPFDAFWLEMHGATKNKIIKLLIPKE